MERFFRELWLSIRYSAWFLQLPEWLREPPGLYVALALLVVVVVLVLVALIRRLLRDLPRPATSVRERATRRQLERNLRREIRELRQAGDERGVGQRYETLGEKNAALAAYRRGGCHAELAALLLRLGHRGRAREAARDGEVWSLYAEICREDGDFAAAAAACERDGQVYAAARSFEAAGNPLEAARCYTAAGMEYNAVQLLREGVGPEIAESLEAAIRSSLVQARGPAMSPDMVAAVRRCAQLWLAADEAERAWRLATDSEQWEVAAPIAHHYLPPTPERAAVCLRAGAHLAAADVYQKLGDTRQEALCRAEHYQRQHNAGEAARWLETAEAWSEAAEQWAAGGEARRAADLFARVGDYAAAAEMYAAAGDEAKQREMAAAAREVDARSLLNPDPTADRPPLGVPPGQRPGAIPPVAVPAVDERYEIVDEIGRGGMGIVYRARDHLLNREVAYKMVPTELTGAADQAEQLLAEARAAARLAHPNIVRIFDAGYGPGGFFVVMELIAGEPFSVLLKKRKLSLNGVVYIARQICAALAHAHQRRIVHRDLKPSNLMWTPERQVKLTDFGLARVVEDSLGKVLTRPAGTPFYMAPEQIRGEPVDVRTDLYSFGCVLFELVCNRAPFSGGSSIYDHLNRRPEDPRSTRREIPEPLAGIILQCLEKDQEKRPRSAEEVGQALAALA